MCFHCEVSLACLWAVEFVCFCLGVGGLSCVVIFTSLILLSLSSRALLIVCCNVGFQRLVRMAIKWLPGFIRPDRGAFDLDFRIIPSGGVLCGLVVELQGVSVHGALCDLFVCQD